MWVIATVGAARAQEYVEPLPSVADYVARAAAHWNEHSSDPEFQRDYAHESPDYGTTRFSPSDRLIPQPPVLPVGYPPELSQPVVDELLAAETAPSANGQKDGCFQQISLTETLLPRGTGGLGIDELSVQTIFAFPLFTRESPLVITPTFGVQFVDGPDTSELPAQLFDASVQVRHLRPIGERWTLDVAVTPGWHGDFEPGAGRQYRLPARALAVFTWSPETKLIAGLAYLDREDVNFLPVAGLIWTPSDDWKIEIVVPRPRVAWRMTCNGCQEDWLYLAGEFGGGSYGFHRSDGAADVATLSDLRLLVGLERRSPGGLNGQLEVGWVFNRQIDYLRSDLADLEPDSTALVRASIWY